ncbi:MAG: DUF6152 family protein [Candidatus Acidiferrales bacterium]
MRSTVFSLLVVAAGLALASGAISAHHGVTNYDMKKTIVLTGTITAFDWSNPHCLAYLDVTDDKGQVRHWTLEMASTFTMTHRGWDKDTLKRGDQVTIETHPARNDVPIGITSGPGFAMKVVANGKEIPSR